MGEANKFADKMWKHCIHIAVFSSSPKATVMSPDNVIKADSWVSLQMIETYY